MHVQLLMIYFKNRHRKTSFVGNTLLNLCKLDRFGKKHILKWIKWASLHRLFFRTHFKKFWCKESYWNSYDHLIPGQDAKNYLMLNLQ